MASSNFLTQGKSAGSLKWTGNFDELKKFCEEILMIDEMQWTRSDGRGANGDPYCCKVGEEVSIRWFPTTKTLQFQGKEADSIKTELLTSLSNFNTDISLNSTSQTSESILSQASEQAEQRCCCARVSKELLSIREEIRTLSAGLSCKACTNNTDEIQQLRSTLSEKENAIRYLEEKNKSYKLALNLLTKELASTNSKIPATEFGRNREENSDESVFVPVSKSKSEAQKQKKKNGKKEFSTGKEPAESQSRSSRSDKIQNDDRKNVLILGDSILKQVEGWKLGRSTKSRTHVKCFPGARVKDCYDYFKPPLKSNPDEIIVHVGTNDLNEMCARDTAENVVNLVRWIESSVPNAKISISEITHRCDRDDMASKVAEANQIIAKFCGQQSWKLINHKNIDAKCLNRSNLHLNKKGTSFLSSNFINNIKN